MQPTAARGTVAQPSDREAIRQIIKNINQAWLTERFEELEQYFHADIVFIPAKFAGRVEGRVACIDTFRDFTAQATVREFRDGEPTIDVIGNAAVATYPFHMLYELADESYREDGYDTFVLSKGDSGWRAIWRMMHINPGVSA